jgi:UDP-N-acetylmuramoylalanine--D-glutamate ligase
MKPLDLDALTLAGVRAGALAGVPVTVLGLARTGVGLTRFLVDAGAVVTVYDGKPAAELADRLAELEGRSVRLLAGPQVDPESAWADATLVAFSPTITPGFPTTEPRLHAALDRLVARRADGDPEAPALVSEPDLTLRLCPSPTVGVTGTKGKTTTASLIAHVLAADPSHPVVLGGNIGLPLIDRVTQLTPASRVVMELSELQLPSLSRGTTVAVYTNVTADHLDRHGTLEAYRAVKRRLAQLVDPAGALVLNLDDPVVGGYAGLGTARSVCYRLDGPVSGGVGIVDGWVVATGVERLPTSAAGASRTGSSAMILPVAEFPLPGRHNLANLLAAVAVGLLFDLAPDAIRVAASTFPGVEHRLEQVGLVDGVRFVNDSQATQPDAVAAALRSFEAPLVLIAGGRDKGVDLAALGPVVAERAAAAILIGESGPALAALFRAAGLRRVEEAGTLEVAVARANVLAHELLATAADGAVATVLLSPAVASFDQFADYAARGRVFKSAVSGLAGIRPPVVAAVAGGAADGRDDRPR